jgi:UDP-N-acetylmuramyl pentapeptide synthase
MGMNPDSEQFYRQDFAAEQELLRTIRAGLADPGHPVTVPDGLKFSFDPRISKVYVTLFQEGAKPLRWGSRRNTLAATLTRIIEKLRSLDRFPDFAVDDPSRCRLLLEVVIEEYRCDAKRLTTDGLNDNRIEPGIHGLRFTCKGRLYYFMPTDAVTHSLMTVKQIFNFLAKWTGVARKTNRISVRASMMGSLISDCRLIKSFACISFEDRALPLYRGYPVPVEMSRNRLRECVVGGSDWILRHMKPNGQFLYYYDGMRDTEVDFQHPNMTDPPYYNILRHSGGTITLLRAYELTGEKKYLDGAAASIEFFRTVIREHEYQGRYACYPFFNKKSKLGGAGIGLVALVHHYRLSGDARYRHYIDGLVNHILSRISDSGEMIGYFIHPRYNDGREIIDPDEETKKHLFSFYYPGEALLGLSLYLKHMPDIEPALRRLVLEKSRRALDFLIHDRPRKYRHLFTPLPADGWLMQAIEEWSEIEGFADPAYIDFVYNDAQAMIDHMYQEHNAPYFDYVGAFYYRYGDHAYPDGARCEGLTAAWHLARNLGHGQQADYFLKYIITSAKNLLYTYNTPQSCYGHKRPAKSAHSFRFKLTRQWMRVDSVQHTACFFARLYPNYLTRSTMNASGPRPADRQMYLDSDLIARLTGGTWHNLAGTIRFHGVRVNITRLERNDICFTTTPEQWGEDVPETMSQLEQIFQNGATGAVITDKRYLDKFDRPLLLINNSKTALEKLALFCRDHLTRIQRVLVTGTEGKTGFKFLLHHLLNKQTQAHATLDSSNLTVPILVSLASLSENDAVEIIECSVAQPLSGSKRSQIVKPHMCVITEVGLQHIATHGSVRDMIRNKASIVEGLLETGKCIINADSENYHALREAIYRRKYVPVLTFGSHPRCNAVLNKAAFNAESLSWDVAATIEGRYVQYVLPLIGEHAPLASISVLLAVHHLGYDIVRAADDFITFKPYETMGKLSRIAFNNGFITFYDHSHRGSLLGFKSALTDLGRLSPERNGRKIAVIGNILNLDDKTKSVHEELAGLIETARIERLHTVGQFMKYTHEKLTDRSILIQHGDTWQDIEESFLKDIRPGDLVFIKGHHRIWLKYLAEKIYQLGEVDEIR